MLANNQIFKKNNLIVLFGFLAVFLLFSPYVAHAQTVTLNGPIFDSIISFFANLSGWEKGMGDALGSIGQLLLNIFGTGFLVVWILLEGLVAIAVGTVAGMVNSFLLGLIQLSISGVSITHSGIVQVGWQVSRDIVNMTFLLLLAVIGLATILRLETYQYKKTLPGLLIVVLLINFSLVLVGFVVDMGNIMSSSFFSYFSNSGPVGIFQSWILVTGYFKGAFDIFGLGLGGQLGTFPFATFAGYAAYGISLILYFFFAALILLIAALLLFFRFIALWILAILSPFAFAAYIFPATRRYWDSWFSQLVQWSLLPVIFGFFLFLSTFFFQPNFIEQSLFINQNAFAPVCETVGDPRSGSTNPPNAPISPTCYSSDDTKNVFDNWAQFLTSSIGPFVGLIFMAMGIFASIQFTPFGAQYAQKIVDSGKKLGKWAGGYGAGRIGRGIVSNPGVNKFMKRMSDITPLSPLDEYRAAEGVRGKLWAAAKSPLSVVSYAPKWAMRKTGVSALQYKTTLPATVDAEMKNQDLQNLFASKDSSTLAKKYFEVLATPERKIAIASLLSQLGDKGIKALDDEGKKRGVNASHEALGLAAERSPKHQKLMTSRVPAIASYSENIKNQLEDDYNFEPKDMTAMWEIAKENGKSEEEFLEIIKNRNRGRTEDFKEIAAKLATQKSVDSLKDPDIEGLSEETVMKPEFLKHALMSKNIRFFMKIGEIHGPQVLAKITQLINDDPDLQRKIAGKNPGLLRGMYHGSGQDVFGQDIDLTRGDWKNIIESIKNQLLEENYSFEPRDMVEMLKIARGKGIKEAEFNEILKNRTTDKKEKYTEIAAEWANKKAELTRGDQKRNTAEINNMRKDYLRENDLIQKEAAKILEGIKAEKAAQKEKKKPEYKGPRRPAGENEPPRNAAPKEKLRNPNKPEEPRKPSE